MNRKNHLAAVLLAAALVFSACNKPANDPQTADSDTASVTPEITETAPTPATPDIPVITEPQTESVQTEPVAVHIFFCSAIPLDIEFMFCRNECGDKTYLLTISTNMKSVCY